MITVIKTVHTIIWSVMSVAIFYILYAGIMHIHNMMVLFAIALVCGEVVVLILNKWTCPLTPMAQKYTSDRNDNFDIYLPAWIARHNKIIFGTIFVVGLLLLAADWFLHL